MRLTALLVIRSSVLFAVVLSEFVLTENDVIWEIIACKESPEELDGIPVLEYFVLLNLHSAIAHWDQSQTVRAAWEPEDVMRVTAIIKSSHLDYASVFRATALDVVTLGGLQNVE
jgi:hypothetical protein